MSSCQACNGTGINSKGGICYPCKQQNKSPLKDAIKDAVETVFLVATAQNRIPKKEELHAAIDRAFQPATTYSVVFRDKDGTVTVMAGPCGSLADALEIDPTCTERVGFFEAENRVVYVVKELAGEQEPVARWNDGKWQIRK